MKKLLALITTALLAVSAIADPPYATDMAIYKENGTTPYFFVHWHNIEMGHIYVLRFSDDGVNWTDQEIVINPCCPLNIWVQESPIENHTCRLFRMVQMD